MADRFEDIRTFVAVVQGGGFNAAADRLGLVKSAVSRRIKDMEERLGVQLINRSTRSLSLTESGDEFFRTCVRIMEDLESAESLVATGALEATGHLRVTASLSFTVHCLAPVIGKFLQANPKLAVEIDASDHMANLVSEGFDVAIRITRLKDSSLVARRIAAIRHVCVASPAYLDAHGRPSKPAELSGHRGVVRSDVEARNYWLFAGGETVSVPSALSFNNGEAIREAASAGCGVALLPSFIAYPAIERGDLEVVLQSHMRPPIAMYAVYASNRHVPAKLRFFVDFMVASFGAEPFWDRRIFQPGSVPSPRD